MLTFLPSRVREDLRWKFMPIVIEATQSRRVERVPIGIWNMSNSNFAGWDRRGFFRLPPQSGSPPRLPALRPIAEVKFAEWTSKGELRQPVYLGLRSDKNPQDVRAPKVAVAKMTPVGRPVWQAGQPAARSDAEGQGGRGGKPRAFRTGPNDRRWAAHAPSRASAA